MDRKFLLINVTDFRYPPVSSAYVMGALKNAGIKYDFIDLPRDNIPLLHEILIRKDFLVAAIGSCIGGYADCEFVFNVIKKTKPTVPTILGGRITSVCPSHLLQKLKADYLVIGDAYPTLIELLHYLSEVGKSTVDSIKGIAFRNKGVFQYTGYRKQPSLDSFFPCWDDICLTQYLYPYQYPVITCIGCVGKCTFCAPGVGPIRIRPVKNVIDEIKEAWQRFHINRFEIISEIFYPSSRHIFEFCDLLSRSAMDLNWRCNLRTDVSTEVFSYMAEAGCHEIIFGVESCENTVLEGMNKLVSEDIIQETIEMANKYGIRVTAGLMAGNVNDTPWSLSKTASFIVDNNIMVDRPYFLTPLQIYPGTELYSDVMRKQLIDNEYEYLKDISQSLYSYLNPLQKRHFLPKTFINLTGMSDDQLEYAIEFNEWIIQQNAFRNWKLLNYTGTKGSCCYCNESFSVERSLRIRENAVVCPNCLAYNLITIDQTEFLKDSLSDVLKILKTDEKIAFIGTRESAYWLTSFVSDNEIINHNWKFFHHAFLNPDSRYLCGQEVHGIQQMFNYEFENLILCDIMCPEYYADLFAVYKKCCPSIYWIVPYNYYRHICAYIPKYACEEELCKVADDLTVDCRKLIDKKGSLAVIQSKEFENVFSEQLLRSGFSITNILDPDSYRPDNKTNNHEFKRCISSALEYLIGIIILDKDPLRQCQITSLFRNNTAENGTIVMSLNEFLFKRYGLLNNFEGTKIRQLEKPPSNTKYKSNSAKR